MAAGMSRKMPKAACLLSVGMHSAIMCKRLVSNTASNSLRVGEVALHASDCFFTLKKSTWVVVIEGRALWLSTFYFSPRDFIHRSLAIPVFLSPALSVATGETVFAPGPARAAPAKEFHRPIVDVESP